METVDHFLIEYKCLDTFWKRISYVFKSCSVSKQVRKLQYLVIGYKSELLEYNWINVLFSYIGFAIYKSYFVVKDGKTAQHTQYFNRRT